MELLWAFFELIAAIFGSLLFDSKDRGTTKGCFTVLFSLATFAAFFACGWRFIVGDFLFGFILLGVTVFLLFITLVIRHA
jgi:hypothetical protein